MATIEATAGDSSISRSGPCFRVGEPARASDLPRRGVAASLFLRDFAASEAFFGGAFFAMAFLSFFGEAFLAAGMGFGGIAPVGAPFAVSESSVLRRFICGTRLFVFSGISSSQELD
jgi:hypothetical protein